MNIPFDIDKGKGPVIADPIRTMAVSGGACGTASAGFFVCVCVCVCWGGGDPGLIGTPLQLHQLPSRCPALHPHRLSQACGQP
jgi:hypothetical protein